MHRGLLLVLTLTALGCAKDVGVVTPEIASPISQQLPQGVGTDIDDQIGDSLPTVSYAVETPDVDAAFDSSDPLDPNAVRNLIRRLESLDGDDLIVCMPTGDTAFGECVFPLPEAGP